MAQEPISEQKATQDSPDNEQDKQDTHQSSHSSCVRCNYENESAIKLKPISKIFESVEQCYMVLVDVFGKDCVAMDNEYSKITLETTDLGCTYVFSSFNQQSKDDKNTIQGSTYFYCFINFNNKRKTKYT